MEIEKKIKTRKSAPKTRTGCLTCKIRRVKCDEARPGCARCASTGRKCDGYRIPQKKESTSPPSVVLARSLNTGAPFDALEGNTIDFFRRNTVPGVSGYFIDPVWDLALQLSQQDMTVRHAMVAMGALHQEIHLKKMAAKASMDFSLTKSKFPTFQYTKALNGLQTLLKSDSVPLNVAIISIILFVHFETLRENFAPALLHLENGIKLLRARVASSKEKVEDSLVQSFSRIDLQASIIFEWRAPGMASLISSDLQVPKLFYDMQHARDIIAAWTSHLYHLKRTEVDHFIYGEPGSIPLETIASIQHLESVFINLDGLLWDFMHSPKTRLTIYEQHGLGNLRSRVKVNRIIAGTCLYAEASVYDRYLKEFEEIMVICNHIIETDSGDRRLISVSLDEGLILPLNFVARLCRDGRIRHQALLQLRRMTADQDIKGMNWYLQTTAGTAELCIGFEEEGHEGKVLKCKDIAEERRIHVYDIHGWDLSSLATCVQVRLMTKPNGMDGEWVEERRFIKW
ncbi:Hypothetical protein R9X50_00164600 [Acrodontium crateriforme]|uniref:Zn(2)-C6 fungal-type domain-containing protein n=1 Tax=Acrodontium crateriforme TaxID=150365 RepID=A0AAQ3LZE5_9PEZI|nr:Hypothetical protein R9X50_00164600 [Acrodontium crateriforme]